MRTKKRIRLKGRLRIYMQTSLYMGILLLIVDIGTYFLDVRAGFLLTCFEYHENGKPAAKPQRSAKQKR